MQLLPRHTFFFHFFITISTIFAIVEKMMKNQFLHQGQDQENFFFLNMPLIKIFLRVKKNQNFFLTEVSTLSSMLARSSTKAVS